jgi:hypothetical protein
MLAADVAIANATGLMSNLMFKNQTDLSSSEGCARCCVGFLGVIW